MITKTLARYENPPIMLLIVKAIQSDQVLPANPYAMPTTVGTNGRITKISEKTFKLAANILDWEAMRFDFTSPSEGILTLQWAGQPVKCMIGMDGRERFSINPLTRLQQACTGKWEDDQTLSLELDLVGAINLYHVACRFSTDAKTVSVSVKEGTGLNNEQFEEKISN